MSTTIRGHTLTIAERKVLNAITDYLRQHSGDSHLSLNTSPNGDGREISMGEIFPDRNNRDSANRRTAYRLAELGVLASCEIQFERGMFKAVPMENLAGK